MKVRIDKHGRLFIDNKLRLCPYSNNLNTGYQNCCGDWCALFTIAAESNATIGVALCKKYYNIQDENFVDQRTGGNE